MPRPISYAVFCLKKKNADGTNSRGPRHVGELAVVVIVLEIVSIVRNIVLDDVRSTVIVIFSVIYAHDVLFTSVRTVSLSSLCVFFFMIRRPPRFTLFPYTTALPIFPSTS